MRKFLFYIFLASVHAFSFGQTKNGYEIDLTINDLPDSTVFLAYHLGDKQYIRDTVRLNEKGHGVFKGQEILPQGIYMIVLPGRKYFEVLMTANQHFSASCSYSDYFNSLKFSGSQENSAFVEYQRRWVKMQQRAASIAKRIQNNRQNTDSLKILGPIQKLQEENMKSYLKSVIKENEGNFLATLVKGMLPIDIPDFPVPIGFANPDSVRWVRNYNYNKDHFFDNIDLNDERLLRTPLLYARLDAFFSSVLIQAPDTINKEIDKLIKKCSGNHKVFQFISVYLFNHFRESEIMGQDAVMVKIADDIYLSGKADWVSK